MIAIAGLIAGSLVMLALCVAVRLMPPSASTAPAAAPGDDDLMAVADAVQSATWDELDDLQFRRLVDGAK